jgi:hypothetical protein
MFEILFPEILGFLIGAVAGSIVCFIYIFIDIKIIK